MQSQTWSQEIRLLTNTHGLHCISPVTFDMSEGPVCVYIDGMDFKNASYRKRDIIIDILTEFYYILFEGPSI